MQFRVLEDKDRVVNKPAMTLIFMKPTVCGEEKNKLVDKCSNKVTSESDNFLRERNSLIDCRMTGGGAGT